MANVRINEEVISILNKLGISLSEAINIFYIK